MQGAIQSKVQTMDPGGVTSYRFLTSHGIKAVSHDALMWGFMGSFIPKISVKYAFLFMIPGYVSSCSYVPESSSHP